MPEDTSPPALPESDREDAVRPRLKSERVQQALAELRGWRLSEDGRSIELQRQFPDPDSALAFVEALAALARRQRACPRIEHVLGGVWVGLATYEAGGVTSRDLDLARDISGL